MTVTIKTEPSGMAPSRKVYTVSRLHQEVQQLLESGFGTLWLQGELSNFSRPGSGHFYFTLKDSQSQIRCAMFKGRNRYIDFQPANGDSVIVRGKLGLYAARGDFQLIVEHMEPAGAGRLQAAFEATKRNLDEQGWFDVSEKRGLPSMPQTIGVVTSPTSAALRDVLQVLRRRYRQAHIVIYPTLTQGAAAAPAIVKALARANARAEADVLLLVRGGGSLEDLWAFNELTVASAIRDSQLPIVAGIGHEVDVTISDLVADLRAPTPSAAAELATPDTSSLEQRVTSVSRQLALRQLALINTLSQQLQQQYTRLQLRHPERHLREQTQRVDDLTSRLQRSWQLQNERQSNLLNRLNARLRARSPAFTVQQQKSAWQALDRRLVVTVRQQQSNARTRFELLARALNSVSPLAVLDRGYALVKKHEQIVTDVASVSPGDPISARVANGEILAVVSESNEIGNIYHENIYSNKNNKKA
ncbi:MAG: exodeoxyribonuclease VII large subunit [Granulosicoccus sp.]